jgi:hypothetical protein
MRKENSVCITAPFYFRSPGTGDPAALQSRIDLTLIHPETKQPVKNARIDIVLHGRTINQIESDDGHASFTMPVNAMLSIYYQGLPAIRRGLYLDYRPHRNLIESFANGRWLEQNNWNNHLSPGQVPWEAFQMETTREVLSNVNWTIEVKPNERDGLWQEFEELFKPNNTKRPD